MKINIEHLKHLSVSDMRINLIKLAFIVYSNENERTEFIKWVIDRSDDEIILVVETWRDTLKQNFN